MRDIGIPAPGDRGRRYRACEALPGCVSWIVLTLSAVLFVLAPAALTVAGVGLLAVAAVTVTAGNVGAVRGYRTMRRHVGLPWSRLLADLDDPCATGRADDPAWHRANLAARRTREPRRRPGDIVHAVIIATWNESREVLEPTVRAVRAAAHDPARVILVVAYEARGGPATERRAQRLVDDHRSAFGHVMAVRHDDRPGEFPGKGANVTTAGRALAAHVAAAGIDPRHVVVTTLDADTRPDPSYLAALTYAYCTVPDPERVSFQPIALYVNNAWDAPAPSRVVAASSSLWNVVLSLRPQLIRNFSAHAQGLRPLIDMDFWSVRTVVEDGHHFWRSYFHHDGRYRVHPLSVPIYQDAVLSTSYGRTLHAQFVQLRRWAWGASDVAYVIDRGWCTPNAVPRRDLAWKLARLLAGHVGWATAPIVLTVSQVLAVLLHVERSASPAMLATVGALKAVALVGLAIGVALSLKLLPPRPGRHAAYRWTFMVLQWTILPVTGLVYNAAAALTSQTRLIGGWYLERFDLTDKAVVTESGARVV
ncbi:MAG TPA: glycosyltransferase family 2 protein [Acidimicrobiales bacterium]|nr:glycosyltransferase family 2 protein [Acidimicrobiales bacterium]